MSYTEQFFESQQQGSMASAEVIVPIITSLFPVRSVIDVGCGVGGWLKTFGKHGVTDHLGIDGDYVIRSQLKISPKRFVPMDLTKPFKIDRTFDLACSLEVAEHLPRLSAEGLIASLVNLAPVVMFSAAVPNQGGLSHINEQPQSFWARLFASHNYLALDCIRPKVFGARNVEWWYRQNTLVYCRPDKLPAGMSPVSEPYEIDRIDPEMIENTMHIRSGTEAMERLKQAGSALLSYSMRRAGLGR